MTIDLLHQLPKSRLAVPQALFAMGSCQNSRAS